MNAKDYAKHEARAQERAAREIAKRVELFRPLTTDELRAKLNGASPWERGAIHRLLRERVPSERAHAGAPHHPAKAET